MKKRKRNHFGLIEANAERLREMNAQIWKGYGERFGGPTHLYALKVFDESFDSLAFPGGLERAMELLAANDPAVIETAVVFLEADPRFIRSGYIKESLAHRLKRAPLTDDQRLRLSEVVVRSVDGGPRRDHTAYARLSRAIPPDLLRPQVQLRASSSNPETRRRAKHVLELLESNWTEPSQGVSHE